MLWLWNSKADLFVVDFLIIMCQWFGSCFDTLEYILIIPLPLRKRATNNYKVQDDKNSLPSRH